VRARDAALPVVVMTGWGSIDTAVDAMRRGAKSFVQKPWDDATLVEVVTREVTEGQATRRRDATLAREYDEARLIQQTLLPQVMPAITGCEIASQWVPAFGIGGDCFDIIRFSDTRLGISIADVIGKGLPAALLMSNLQAAVRAFATPTAQPADVCESVNRLLCRNIATGKFVTFCYAVLDTAGGTITYANAGHNHPILRRADGAIDRLVTTGLVLGVASDWSYASGHFDIRAGDRLVCFTDGITEAVSADDEEFGDARLVAAIATAPNSAEGITAGVMHAVRAWTGGAFQDDATLIAATFTRAQSQ
jgi:sigma-B regulation protein RsbU (phosphoserine phosphatase)